MVRRRDDGVLDMMMAHLQAQKMVVNGNVQAGDPGRTKLLSVEGSAATGQAGRRTSDPDERTSGTEPSPARPGETTPSPSVLRQTRRCIDPAQSPMDGGRSND